MHFKTPVVFIIFKRPSTTEKVFEMIRETKPQKLFVIADGARINQPGEEEKCAATRAIIERVDWDCEIFRNYSEINLGCAKRVSTGLNWVFDQVEEAIILEEDCVPHSSFFHFCEELLERYRDDSRIVSISGQNVQLGRKRTEYSYYFSRYNHCWGWATWRRAWQYFDFNMKLWPEIQARGFIQDILVDSQAVQFWTKLFQSAYDGEVDLWACRWTFACWIQSGISILSNVNSVSNIGFGLEASNTKSQKMRYANLPAEPIEFPLKHPPFVISDRQADRFTQKLLYSGSAYNRFKAKIKKTLGWRSLT